ncbi:MAG: hypothetical protein ACI4WX_13900 [Aristaeellaceae bacterium]
MNKPSLNPRWIHLLLTIKHACMEDNDLSEKVCRCGKFAVAHYMDELIACAVKLETACEEYFAAMEREEEENQAFYDLFEGYTPDIMTDEHIAELKAMVKKWNGEHEDGDTE